MQGKYTTMDAKTWFTKYVLKHKNIKWEIDFRTLTDEQAKATAKKLKELFKGNEKILDRILLQVGTEEMYNQFHKYLPTAKNYQYFIHKAELKKVNDVIDFCTANEINAMAVNYEYMSKSIVREIKDANMNILCYTVDDVEVAKDMLDMGADCVCSNFLNKKDFK